MKRGALPRLTAGPDVPIVILYHFTCNGEPYSCTGVFSFAVEALEHLKDLFGVLWLKPNPIVAHFNQDKRLA